jgi:hypothetical protein
VTLVLIALAVAAGCRGGGSERGEGSVQEQHARVRALLHDEGLVGDPEVQAKMSETVVRIRRRELSREAAYREFREWLEAWAREHPARAEAARERVRPRGGVVPGR